MDRDSGVFGGGCQITCRDRRIVYRNDVDRENTLDRDIGVRGRSRRAVVPQGHPNPSILTRIAVDVLGRLIDQRTIDTNGGLHHKRSGVQRDDFESQLLIGFIGCGDWTWADAGCKTRNRYDTLVFVGRRRSRNREFRSVIDWSNDDRERRIRADVVVGERTCATVVDQVDDDDGRPVLVRSRHEGQLTGRGDSRLGAEQPGVGVERHVERQGLGNLVDSRRRPGSHIGCKTDDASGGYSGDRFVVFQDRNERRGNGVLRLVVDIGHIEGQ